MLDREEPGTNQVNPLEESLGLEFPGKASEEPRQTKGRGRGFASMNAEKQREIASKGGKAAHQKGTAHEFSSEEAREAGRKGGQARGQRHH
jgi:general stress protein YciG